MHVFEVLLWLGTLLSFQTWKDEDFVPRPMAQKTGVRLIPDVSRSLLDAVEKCSKEDARIRQEQASFIWSMIRFAKSAIIENTENQLTFAYQSITAGLRPFINAPQASATVHFFN